MALQLLLLAAHLLGDFPLQPKWMSVQKLDDPKVRLLHVSIYTVPFGLFLLWVQPPNALEFLTVNFIVHFIIDSNRWMEAESEYMTYIFDQVFHITTLAILATIFF